MKIYFVNFHGRFKRDSFSVHVRPVSYNHHIPMEGTNMNSTFKTKIGKTAVLSATLLFVAGIGSSVFAQTSPGQTGLASPPDPKPAYTSSIQIKGNGENTEESVALKPLAKIDINQAQKAALGANPGTTVVKSELDNENGSLVYSVTLDNGLDVKIDAGTAAVLHTEKAGAENDEHKHGNTENQGEYENSKENRGDNEQNAEEGGSEEN